MSDSTADDDADADADSERQPYQLDSELPVSFAVDSVREDAYDDDGSPDADYIYRDRAGAEIDTAPSSDEVDPKKLVRTPDINDIRWYYRNGGIAPTIVDKPVDDAFKHGFEVEGDDQIDRILHETMDEFQFAHKHARKDGLSLLWFRLEDSTEREHEQPRNVSAVDTVKTLTLDDLSEYPPLRFQEILDTEFGLDRDRVEITDEGIVMCEQVDHDRFDQPLGYIFDLGVDTGAERPDEEDKMGNMFIHHERVMNLTWRQTVSGDIDDLTYGRHAGDSVLRPIIHILRTLHKCNWAVGQTMWRHSAPLHVMEVPEGADSDHYDRAEQVVRNINAKSSVTEPPGFELRTVDSVESEYDPTSTYEILYDQICANSEFTKSVLFGTQSGTVSGSEVDIKNYFNKVERMRNNRFEDEFSKILRLYEDWGLLNESARQELSEMSYDIHWGPLFKLEKLDEAESMRTAVNMASQAVSNYILTPDEARNLLEEDWLEVDEGVDLSALDEPDLDYLDRVNVGRTFNTRGSQEAEMEGSPRQSNGGGGNEQGSSMSSSNPAADSSRHSDVDSECQTDTQSHTDSHESADVAASVAAEVVKSVQNDTDVELSSDDISMIVDSAVNSVTDEHGDA